MVRGFHNRALSLLIIAITVVGTAACSKRLYTRMKRVSEGRGQATGNASADEARRSVKRRPSWRRTR